MSKKSKGLKEEVKPHVKKIPFSATSMTSTVTPIFKNEYHIPTVKFTREAWTRMWKIVEICQEEVGWLGLVDETDYGYLITDIYLLEQEVSGVTTDIEADAVGRLACELESAGIDSSKLRYWGHSHVNMGVSPSGQDESQTSEYIEHCDFFLRGIHNKKMEYKMDVFDMRSNLVFQKVNCGVHEPQFGENWVNDLKAEIKAKVKKKVYNYAYNPGKWNKTPTRGYFSPGHVVRTAADINEDIQKQREFSWDKSYGYGWDY